MQRAVIVGGGGGACVWNTGVFDYLIEFINQECPEVLKDLTFILCSGSSPNVFSLAGKKEQVRQFWENEVHNFFHPKKGLIAKLIDVEGLVNSIRKFAPTSNEEIEKIQPQVYIPVTNAKTGKMDYLSPKDKNVDVYKSLTAGMWMPWTDGIRPRVEVNGQYFCDSPLSSAPQSHISMAVENGANKILIIDVKRENETNKYDPLLRIWENVIPGREYRLGHKSDRKRVSSYIKPDDVKLYTLTPSGSGAGTLEKDPLKYKSTFENGIADIRNYNHLAEFLQ